MLFSVLADEIFLLRPCPEAVVPLTLRARCSCYRKIANCYDSANDVVHVPFVACVCLAIAVFFYTNRLVPCCCTPLHTSTPQHLSPSRPILTLQAPKSCRPPPPPKKNVYTPTVSLKTNARTHARTHAGGPRGGRRY